MENCIVKTDYTGILVQPEGSLLANSCVIKHGDSNKSILFSAGSKGRIENCTIGAHKTRPGAGRHGNSRVRSSPGTGIAVQSGGGPVHIVNNKFILCDSAIEFGDRRQFGKGQCKSGKLKGNSFSKCKQKVIQYCSVS